MPRCPARVRGEVRKGPCPPIRRQRYTRTTSTSRGRWPVLSTLMEGHRRLGLPRPPLWTNLWTRILVSPTETITTITRCRSRRNNRSRPTEQKLGSFPITPQALGPPTPRGTTPRDIHRHDIRITTRRIPNRRQLLIHRSISTRFVIRVYLLSIQQQSTLRCLKSQACPLTWHLIRPGLRQISTHGSQIPVLSKE